MTKLSEQKIIACPTCGMPNGNCDPPCRDGVVLMTKGEAADLAIMFALSEINPKEKNS